MDTTQPRVPAVAEAGPEAGVNPLLALADSYGATAESLHAVNAAQAAGGSEGGSLPIVMVGGGRNAAPQPNIVERTMSRISGYAEKLSVPSLDMSRPAVRYGGAFAVASLAVLNLAAKTGLINGAEPAKASDNAPRVQGVDYGSELGNSVNHAVKELDAQGAKQVQAELEEIFANPDKYNDLSVSHVANMQSRLKDFNEDNITQADMIEGVALSVLNDYGYRQSVANALQGIDPTAPRTDSAEDQIALIASAMTGDDTRFGMTTLNGLYVNHGQRSDVDVFGDATVFFGVKAMVISAPGFETVVVKAGGGTDGTNSVCLNIETLLRHQQPPSTPPGTPPGTPPTTTIPPRIPPRHPGITVFTPHIPPSTPHIPGKVDHNDSNHVAGNDNQNGGTPDVAGKGPAGQQAGSDGFVDGEAHPAAQAQDPAPAPLPNDVAPSGPAETGTSTGAAGEAGAGTGSDAPTSDVQISG